MVRECPNCHEQVSDSRLVVCPTCHNSLIKKPNKNPVTLTPEEEKRILRRFWRNVFKRVLLFAGIISLLTGVSLFGIYKKLTSVVTNRIAAQFEEPRIKETLQNVAKTRAKDIINQHVDPELSKFRKDLSEKTKESERYLSKMKNEFDKNNKAISSELSKLQDRNKILDLGDDAIAGMSFRAYSELFKFLNNPSLTDAAVSELLKVKLFYLTSTRTGSFKLAKSEPEQLIKNLSDSKNWKVRAVSARLLGSVRKRGVPNALLTCMENDQNLEVRRDAVIAFGQVTGFHSPDVFGWANCDAWWKDHSKEVNSKLKEMKKSH